MTFRDAVFELCPECGDPLDDYSPCSCILSQRRVAPKERRGFRTNMRDMVARKLGRAPRVEFKR